MSLRKKLVKLIAKRIRLNKQLRNEEFPNAVDQGVAESRLNSVRQEIKDELVKVGAASKKTSPVDASIIAGQIVSGQVH
jgi:hypothetical protein